MNEFNSISNDQGLLKQDYEGAQSPISAALKRKREKLKKTKLDPIIEIDEKPDESQS